MVIKNRLFPYPVLCEDSDDYIEGEFYVNTSLVEQGVNDILVKFEMNLENPGLQELISKGMAEYVIHIECSDTAFRTVIRTSSNSETYRIMNSRVNGNINLLAMIVSKDTISGFKNDYLNDDYDGINITIPKASILAYENMDPIHISKNYEELAEKDSIFSIIKKMRIDQNEHNKIQFRLDQDRIKITVDDDIYNNYIKYQNNSAVQSIMRSLLIIPALTYMLEILRTEDYEPYEDAYWFIKLQNFYKNNGLNFIDDIINGEDMISDIVQDMLMLPIGDAILRISEVLGE
ncbi:hypothetical protein [Oribacterium sp. P6A1]|uniref:hypothetical protein n=1 Tax=Oribacterium sp. P6A1 TaxID=1410612 RepID=UPI00056895BD|nr:hypothetical protein [Oribacterium sp. P6A1]